MSSVTIYYRNYTLRKTYWTILYSNSMQKKGNWCQLWDFCSQKSGLINEDVENTLKIICPFHIYPCLIRNIVWILSRILDTLSNIRYFNSNVSFYCLDFSKLNLCYHQIWIVINYIVIFILKYLFKRSTTYEVFCRCLYSVNLHDNRTYCLSY